MRSLFQRRGLQEYRCRQRKPERLEFHVEPFEQRLLLAASDWDTPSPYVTVTDLVSGVEDRVLVTIGNLDGTPVGPEGRHEATLENLVPGLFYTVTVEYDLSTTGSFEIMAIFAGGATLLAPTDDYLDRPLLVNVTGTITFRVMAGSTFSVGLQNYDDEPTDSSYGTMEITTDIWQPEQSHSSQCDVSFVSGGTAAVAVGENHRGDGTSSISIGSHELYYNSSDNPHPILTAPYLIPDNARASSIALNNLDHVRATLRVNGAQYGTPVVFNPSDVTSLDTFTSAFQVDASDLGATFEYEIALEGIDGRGFRIGGEYDQTVSATYSVHDRSESYFGDRFWLAEIDEIELQPKGVTLLSGESDAIWFEKASLNPLDGTYISPNGVFSTMSESGGIFTLTDHYGFKRNFDISGKMFNRVDPNGNVTKYIYTDANGDGDAREISKIIDPFGRETTIGYRFGMATSITDFGGRETTLGFNGGRLTSVRRPDPDADGPLVRPETTMLYGADGKLTGIRDPRNATNTLNYDPTYGLVTGGGNADGSSWSLSSMLSVGLVDPVTATGAVPTSPSSDRNASHVDTLGNRTQTTTDAFGLITSLTDALGNDYEVKRDHHGRPIAVVEPDPDGAGPLGTLVTRISYADCANISRIVFADGSTNRWTYNDVSQPTTFIDGIGRTTRYQYDASGFNLIRQTQVLGELDSEGGTTDDPADIVHHFTYSNSGALPKGLLLTETDPLGRVTSYTYEADTTADDYGWLKEVTYAQGTADEASVQYEYDAAGNVTAYTDELGHQTDYAYDELDRLVAITEPDPNSTGAASERPVTTYEYDTNDNLVKSTDAEGNATEFDYDEYNRMVETREAAPDEASEQLVTTFVYDGNNNLVRTVDPGGRVTNYEYDELDRLIATIDDDVDGTPLVTNPLVRYDVDANGIVDAQDTASIDSTDYDSSLLSFDPRTERPDYYDVDADGAITTGDLDSVQGFIDIADTNLDGIVDVAEIRAAGISSIPTNLDSQPITHTEYDNVGNVSATIDANGNRMEFRYDERHRLIETILPAIDDEFGTAVESPTTANAYDLAGQLISTTDALGRTTTYEYDDAGRQITAIEPDADDGAPTTRFEYDLASNLVRIIDSLQNETRMEYDDRDRLIRRTDPDPSADNGLVDVPVTTFEYDDANRLTAETAPENRATEYVYDDLNRVIEIRLPIPTVSAQQSIYEYAYDKVGNRLGEIDPEGNLTRYRYDNIYRLTHVIGERPDGTPVGTQQGLSAAFNTQAIASLRTSYPVTEYAYDAASNVIQITDPLQRETRFAYDQLHRRTITAYASPTTGNAPAPEAIQPGNSTTPMMAYRYDLFGNVLSVQDATSNPRTYTYDAWHRPTVEADENGDETQYHYDLVDNLRFLVDPELNSTGWQYDDLNRNVHQINPQGFTRDFAYDLADNLIQNTDRNGRVTSYTYDDLYRVTSERWYTDASHFDNATLSPLREITFEYDTASRITNISDPDATYDYIYDGLDRVQIASQQLAGLTPIVAFGSQFDRKSQTTRTNVTIGGQIDTVNTMDYDNLLRLKNITQQSSSTGTGNAVAYKQIDLAYDLANQRTSLERRAIAPDGPIVVSTRYQFDQVGRIKDITHRDAVSTDLAGYNYQYRADNRISQITSIADATGGATGTVNFGYDQRGQLVSEQYDFAHYQHARTFDYDQNGNRDEVNDYDGTIDPVNLTDRANYQTPTNNRLTDDGTFTYTYDGEGNRVTRTNKATRELTEYEWDHRNRLVTVTTSSPSGEGSGSLVASAGGEVGTVTIDQLTAETWITVSLHRQYVDPVVVTGPASMNDSEQATVRVRNVAATSFEIQLDEWDYQDGSHGAEQVAYIVMESGTYELTNGTKVEAGTVISDQRPRQRFFDHSFDDAPVVLASTNSANDDAAVDVRVDHVDQNGFRVRMFEEHASRKDPELRKHAWERIGYIAISGSGTFGTTEFKVGTAESGRIVDASTPVRVTFADATVINSPVLFATNQTVNGGDTIALRFDNLSSTGVDFYSQEELSYDAETGHYSETIGYAVFDEMAGTFDLTAVPAGGEAGAVAFDQVTSDAWVTVSLLRQYVNPVVVTGPASLNDSAQATVRVRNVTSTSFEIQLDEWDYLDGVHASESVGYLVVDAGRHLLADGSVLEAGTVTTDFRRTAHEFGLAFDSQPVIMASAMTANDPAAVITRIGDVSNHGFHVQLREEELARQSNETRTHAFETVGYIALTSSAMLGDLSLEMGTLDTNSVVDQDTAIPLAFTRNDQSDSSILLATMQTHNGGNTAGLRVDGLTATGANLFIREEQSHDTETRHIAETIGYFALPVAGTFELTTVETTATARVENAYDAFNQWVGQITDADGDPTTTGDRTHTAFVHHNGQIVYEFTGITGSTAPLAAEDLQKRNLWSNTTDELLAQETVTNLTTSGQVTWPLGDHLNTIRDVIDSTGAVMNHRTYNAFGELVHETNPTTETIAFGYTGRYFEENTRLQNNLNRWYDPAVGRWISEDPIGFDASDSNLYRYVGNSPTNATDPSGLVGYRMTAKNPDDPYVNAIALGKASHGSLKRPQINIRSPATGIPIDRITSTQAKVNLAIGIGKRMGYPFAAAMLSHYEGNSGKPFNVPINTLLAQDKPSKTTFDVHLLFAQQFVEKNLKGFAKGGRAASVEMTNVNTENLDWDHALAGYATWAEITNANCTNAKYSMTFTYHIRDYYDWSGNNGLGAGPKIFGVQLTLLTDKELHNMHKFGVMQNFDVNGKATYSVSWTSNTRLKPTLTKK